MKNDPRKQALSDFRRSERLSARLTVTSGLSLDYRCRVCSANPGKRQLSQTIAPRMAIECSHCSSVIRLNVHRAETIIVPLNFATIVVLAVFAYWFRSRGLVLVAVGAAIAGASALPLLERTALRTWPRYAASIRSPNA